MHDVVYATSNSLPIDASKKPNRSIPTHTPCNSMVGSNPGGLNRAQHMSERCSSKTRTNLSLSQPKLRLEALNRSFHNAANELKESLNSGLMNSAEDASTSSLVSNSTPTTQRISFATGLIPNCNPPRSTTAFVRHFSLKIKNHVQTSLSDPLRRKGSTKRILDSPFPGIKLFNKTHKRFTL